MKTKLIIMVGACAALLAIYSTAMATPYPLQFDPDAAGTNYTPATIWGWDLEAVAKEAVAPGQPVVDIVTHQQLGADGILSNGDAFTEDITVSVLDGLGQPPGYAGPGGGGPTPSYLGFPGFVPSANLFIDIALQGFINNVTGPNNTTATNPTQISQNSFNSVFTAGTGTMYVDANNNMTFDAGETIVATFNLTDAGNFILVPSVFGPGGSATIDFAFQTTGINLNYFGNAPGYPNFLDYFNNAWHFTLTQGDVAFSGQIAGNTAVDPDEILLGWQETGFDAKFDVVPEPSTILLLGCGLIGVAAIGRKKFSK